MTVSGKKEVIKVTAFTEEVVDPEDIEMLEDLIVAATNEALSKVEEATKQFMCKMTGGLRAEDFRSDGLLQRSYHKADRRTVQAAGYGQ